MMTQQFDKQIPLLLRIFENALRSGYSVDQGLEILSKDLPDPAGSDVHQVFNEIQNGTPLLETLDHWLGPHAQRGFEPGNCHNSGPIRSRREPS